MTLNKTNIKGDWIGLYRKFFRSRNFNSWYNTRYKELSQKLQALHTEALSNAVSVLYITVSEVSRNNTVSGFEKLDAR